MLGNRSIAPITSFGSGTLKVVEDDLKLCNMFFVPQLAKNMISIKGLCKDKNVVAEFFHDPFCIKELQHEKKLLVGGTDKVYTNYLTQFLYYHIYLVCQYAIFPTMLLDI